MELSDGLKWAAISRFATKTPGSGDQLVWEYVHDPVASAKDTKTLKIAQI